MSNITFAMLAFGTALVAWTIWAGITAGRTRRQLGGVRLVDCPETGAVAAVRFDCARAAMTAVAFDGQPDVRLADCSRWPERGPCDGPCVPQAKAPESSVMGLIAHFTGQGHCAICGGHLAEAPAVGHHIALRSPDGVTTQWTDLSLAALPQALLESHAVCWDCHIAESFRRALPHLVTDR